jgi:hypothetical protein
MSKYTKLVVFDIDNFRMCAGHLECGGPYSSTERVEHDLLFTCFIRPL